MDCGCEVRMEQNKNRGVTFKLAIIWLAIILLGSFAASFSYA